jgi:peptide/bleomycin uptake transporter
MIKLLKPFFTGSDKKYAIGMGIFLSILALTTVGMSYLFLEWYGAFYNALEVKDGAAFTKQLGIFAVLAFSSINLYAFSRYFNMKYALRWREYLTFHLLRKGHLGIEGSSQRIQEDTLKFTKLTEKLFLGILDAVVSIIVFTPILWGLSNIVFPGQSGLLLYIGIGYALGGMLLSYIIGKPLPKLEYNNQRVEASFRTALEYDSGEYKNLFEGVKDNYLRLFKRYKYFNLWAATFFQVSVILPYLLAGPAYFSGVITLGMLVQVGKAFDKLQSSMSYLTDNWLEITELQSVVKRLNEYEEKINGL